MSEQLTDTLPAGTYFIGDPCYCFSHDHHDIWMEYLHAMWSKEDECHMIRGYMCFASGTMHGDGVYPDNFGNEYCVDAGLIGATPIEIAEGEFGRGLDYLKGLGKIVTFDRPFEVTSIDNDGVIQIGDILIDTDDEDEEEYYE